MLQCWRKKVLCAQVIFICAQVNIQICTQVIDSNLWSCDWNRIHDDGLFWERCKKMTIGMKTDSRKYKSDDFQEKLWQISGVKTCPPGEFHLTNSPVKNSAHDSRSIKIAKEFSIFGKLNFSFKFNIFCFLLQVRCKSPCERLKMCDRYTDGEIPEYFFDR